MLGFFAQNWFQVEYWPAHQPWYDGAVYGNLFVVPIAVALSAFIWPPFRKRLHRFVDGKLAPIGKHLADAREQRERIHAESLAAHAETQRHLAHVIKHSSEIPDLPPKPTARALK